MDISNSKSVNTAIDIIKIKNKVKHIDIIYNNTGVINKFHKKSFSEIDFDSALEIININSIGFLRIMQAIYDMLVKDTLVIVILSGAGKYSNDYGNNFINYIHIIFQKLN